MARQRRKSEAERRSELVEAAFRVACRRGIDGLTLRSVADEAQVSHALVLFHFGVRDQMVAEVLDCLIDKMVVLRVSTDIVAFPRPLDRLHAILQEEIDRVIRQPEQARLFLEFWALGAHDGRIRSRIAAEVGRYRSAFLATMDEVLLDEPSLAGRASASGLAAVAVSWIQGCAVQALLDPEHFDSDEYLRTVRGLLDEILSGTPPPGRSLN